MKKNALLLALSLIFSLSIQAQDTDDDTDDQGGSVIQNLTPSKLIGKGQYDVKWFNNLYTQTESTFSEGTEPRETFFTSSVDAFVGVSENRRINVGAIIEFRSNVIQDRGAFDVFSFDGERGTARSGITSIAPAIKFVPFKSINNFSIQSSFSIPLIDREQEDGIRSPRLDEEGMPVLDENGNPEFFQEVASVFLDQNGFTWQNRFFYDYTFEGGNWQLFGELNSELHFGEDAVSDGNNNTIEGSFANNSLSLTPGIFLSYFPSSKFTILALAQHSERIDIGNDFAQDFTAVGGGAKYQLTDELNIETLYTNFVRGNNTGLGATFNLGLRAVF